MTQNCVRCRKKYPFSWGLRPKPHCRGTTAPLSPIRFIAFLHSTIFTGENYFPYFHRWHVRFLCNLLFDELVNVRPAPLRFRLYYLKPNLDEKEDGKCVGVYHLRVRGQTHMINLTSPGMHNFLKNCKEANK